MKNVLISLVNFFVTDRVFYDIKVLQISRVRGCSYGGELARLNGLARLGEMILSHVHMESSQLNQKVCYVAGKRLFGQVFFYNKVT